MQRSYTNCLPRQPLVFDDGNNDYMEPWNRLDAELARKRKTWVSLGNALGLSKQSITHWKTRGIPAKYLRGCAEFIGKPLEWLEFGEQSGKPEPEPEPPAQPVGNRANSGAALARWFEKLPQDNNIRNLVFVECWAIIERNLPGIALEPTDKHSEHDVHETPVAKRPA